MRLISLALLAFALLASRPALGVTIAVPTVEITALGHVFAPSAGEIPASILDAVSFPCGAELGACSGSGFSAAVQNGDSIEIRFAAPAGFKFSVLHLPGSFLSFSSEWEAGVDAISTTTTPSFVFENLSGTAATPDLLSGSVSDAGRVIRAKGLFEVTGDFAFTALAISFVVSNTVPGTLESFGPVGDPGHFGSFAFSRFDIDATLMALVALPEPSSLALLLAGASLALGAARRRLA